MPECREQTIKRKAAQNKKQFIKIQILKFIQLQHGYKNTQYNPTLIQHQMNNLQPRL